MSVMLICRFSYSNHSPAKSWEDSCFSECKRAISEKIRETLLPEEVILRCSFNDTELNTCLITCDSVWFKRQVPGDFLKECTSRFVRSIKQVDRDDFLKDGRTLYNYLIFPFLEQLNGKERMIIVSEGKLSELPFEALVMEYPEENEGKKGNGAIPFLINRFEISYTPSLYYWYQASLNSGSKTQVRSYLGFAPVSFMAGENEQLNRLPFSENEILEIGDLFRKKDYQAVTCLYDEATKIRLDQEIKGKSCIHFATHSVSNFRKSSGSGLVLSGAFSNEEGNTDGILHYEEILCLSIDAHLVVLNACSTGKELSAGAISHQSLSRAFIQAGARNVIFSLWNVTDKYGHEFIKCFYKKVLEGKNYSTSLRETKLDFIARRETSLPYLWAGFILEGE